MSEQIDLSERIRKDRKIDPHQLDIECVQQADLFYDYAEASAKCRRRVDTMEFDIGQMDAKIQLDSRTSPERFGISNPTEAAFKAAVQNYKPLKMMRKKLIRLKYNQKIMEQAVAAMEMKKRMLEKLIDLHGQSYFAGPAGPRDLVAAWTQYTKGVSDSANSKQSDKARKRVKRES